MKTKTAVLLVACCVGSFFAGYIKASNNQAAEIRRLSEANRQLQENIGLLRLPLMVYLLNYGELTEEHIDRFFNSNKNGSVNEKFGRIGQI